MIEQYESVTPVFEEWIFSLEDILTSLDNEFTEGDNDTKPTVAMIEAAEHFKQVVNHPNICLKSQRWN